MEDREFSAACRALGDRLFPTPDRDGPLGDVPADASLLRELLGRYGGCKLWVEAYRECLQPFAEAFRQMETEAGDARSVGHDYPDGDEDVFPVPVCHLRRAAKLLGDKE